MSAPRRDPDHPLGDRITVTLHELVDALDDIGDALLREQFDVTLSQYLFLAVLADLDAPDITEQARCLGVTKAAVSKRLPSFVQAGWVRTGTDPTHARRVLLHLTDPGTRLVADAGQVLDAEFTAMAARLTDIDLDALHQALKTLLTTLHEKDR
ncbi:MarR family winged helix-turn-helix transcriptional regulator [Cellulomonas soli]